MNNIKPVIVSAVRTPVGKFGGSLKGVDVTAIGSLVIKEALKRAGVKPVLSDKLKEFRPVKTKERGLSEVGQDYNNWPNDL